MTFVSVVAAVLAAYLFVSLVLTYVVHRVPRKPVRDGPDWGKAEDVRISASDGGFLEVWRVDPEGETPSRGVVLLAHGWSRNRDRMVGRARVFGRLGFTTVMHSARDHGGSSPYPFMNAFRFAEDIETVMRWIGQPVLLYGHSAGAAGALIAAHRNPGMVRLLFLEGCYARTKDALMRLYRSFNRVFGWVFAPAIVTWMDLFYGFRMDGVSPVKLAPSLDIPVMLIHGEMDQHFPLFLAWELRDAFPAGRAELFVALGSDHSSSSLDPAFPAAVEAFVRRRLDAAPLKEETACEPAR